MREFTKVSPSLWRSSRFKALGDNARLIYLYLLTSEHQNSAGAFRLPSGYALVDLAWDEQRYETALSQLVNADMVERDQDTDEVRICRWFAHNPPMNDKHRKGIVALLGRLESKTLQERAAVELNEASPEQPLEARQCSNGFASQNDLTKTGYMQGTARR